MGHFDETRGQEEDRKGYALACCEGKKWYNSKT
jgi:hypothetical protein